MYRKYCNSLFNIRYLYSGKKYCDVPVHRCIIAGLMGTEEKSQFPSPDQSRNSLSAEKRKRKFQPSWQAQYDWLEYNEEEGMFCANCRKYPHLAGKKKH